MGLTCLAAAWALGAPPQPGGQRGVPDARFAKLSRGINLSHWFAQVFDKKGYTQAHFDTYITAADLDLVAGLGFRHVRLSVEPKPLMKSDGSLDAAYLQLLDNALDAILARGLAVIVDIHAHPDFNKALQDDDDAVKRLGAFWKGLAGHLSRRDPEAVFLEVLNEPQVKVERWSQLQPTLIAAIRAGAPRHTIIATGGSWGGIDELLKTSPVSDDNVVYNFHFYDPGLFTHQGANWGWHTWEHAKGVPYPMVTEALGNLLDKIAYEPTRKELAHEAAKRWDAVRIEGKLKLAADWARKHDVRVTCNEFGVYRPHCDPRDRAEWLRDVRTACERLGIGWTMWDYAGGFSLVQEKGGERVADPLTVRALGLGTHTRN